MEQDDDTLSRPLHYCIICGGLPAADCLRLLLDCGADVNVRDVNGKTPLILAAKGGQLQAVRTLFERGADFSLTANDGTSAFDMVKTMQIRASTSTHSFASRAASPLSSLVHQGEAAAEAAMPASGAVNDEAVDAELQEAIKRSLADVGGFAGGAPPDATDEQQSPSAAFRAEEQRAAEVGECCICLSAPKSAGLLHGTSMHAVCCEECAPLLISKPCPVCRQPVERILLLAHIYT